MALGKLTFVPTGTSGTLVAYDQIPEDVISDLEDAWEVLGSKVGRIHATFTDEAEKGLFSQYAASWAAQRPGGKLVFRWSPTKGNQKNEGDFTLKRDVGQNANGGDATPPVDGKTE